ncbi:hypothetical protein LRP67_19395 [Nocardioides sp. cx-169]|uniref:hypothetical protein n=1 Tax=Nocardioides sp. cx-169 TaxID=2899080 RepID=UPI001E578277|nr:hypothetical protein [Nocardioides sp. cx-169]MCD4536262.1 hypothetical protein [Nocardioides sp. cx-169]
MNDVRTLFESVLTDPPPDTLDLDHVIARGTRRRAVRRAVTAGAGLAATLMIGTGFAYVAMPGDTDTAPPATVEPTPTIRRTAAPLRGSGTGIGEWSFGDAAGEVITEMTRSFGAPDWDSAWDQLEPAPAGFAVDGDDPLSPSWDHRQARTVCWQSLCAAFGGETVKAATFRGWELARSPSWNDYEPVDATQPQIRLADSGIALGDTWAELSAAYPDVVPGGGEGASLTIDDPPWPGIFDGVGEWRLSGTWDSSRPRYAPPGAEVTRMSAGEGLEPGCC